MASQHLILLTTILCIIHCVCCMEFQVGERVGWIVPPSNDTNFYNEWASHKRFTVGDTIRFKYEKDSVMEVNKTNYNQCNSTRPNFFSNTGKTIYTLDRVGFFYFISGSAGHCEKGQRMVIWVIGQDPDSRGNSHASKISAILSYAAVFVMVSVQIVYLH